MLSKPCDYLCKHLFKGLSKISCSVDLSDRWGVFSLRIISPVVLFPIIVSIYTLGAPIFRINSESLLLFFFFFDCNVSSKNLSFCFFVSSKDQTPCTGFLQTGTWSLFIYFGCFPRICPIFLEHRSNFREVFHKSSCSTKWCDEI